MNNLLEDEVWDAQDMGCGELLLALRKRLRAMSGKTIKVIAHDKGAQEDLPAFCRITRHEMLCANPPAYWIKARLD